MVATPFQARAPRDRIERECARRGRHEVINGCIELLGGGSADPELIVALGGPPARWAITGEPSGPDYWLRVWAARGLLWAWDERAEPVVLRSLEDDAWRVREMALRVVARYRLHAAAAAVSALEKDPTPRVRVGAGRALRRLESG